MTDAPPILEIHGLIKTWRDAARPEPVLNGVDLAVAPGELLAIVGRSGSGKTTLLSVMGGLDRDYRGHVRVLGRDLQKLSDRELSALRNRSIGFVFQFHHLLPHLTCLENVLVPWHFGDRLSAREAGERAASALERVGLPDVGGRRPSQLSGGEQQRVAIARALFFGPPLLLCDEPTGSLDRRSGEVVLDLFEELSARDGVTVVIISHEAWIARRARRVVRVADGRLTDAGAETVEDVG
jgi:ABC-type lipoprotein export system ATPase subunit